MSHGLTRGKFDNNVVVVQSSSGEGANLAASQVETVPGNGAQAMLMTDGNAALSMDTALGAGLVTDPSLSQNRSQELRAEARIKGYEGEACSDCGNFTLVRNGTCLKCDTCGSTSGCS